MTNILQKIKTANRYGSTRGVLARDRTYEEMLPFKLRDKLMLNMRISNIHFLVSSLRFVFTVKKIPLILPECRTSGVFFPLQGHPPIIYTDCTLENLILWSYEHDVTFQNLYISAPSQAMKLAPMFVDKYNM